MLFTPPISHVVDRDGRPLVRAQMAFFQAGTRVPLTTYREPLLVRTHPETIAADDAGRFPPVWLPVATTAVAKYKVECTGSDGGLIYAVDGLELPTASSAAAATTYAAPLLTTADGGNNTSITLNALSFKGVLSVNASSTNIPVILPQGSTLTAGRNITIRQAGVGAAVAIQAAVSSEVIDTSRGFPLTQRDECVTIVWDGGSFQAIDHSAAITGFVLVRSEEAAPPATPITGGIYLATASVGSTWSKDRLYKADGLGGWIGYVPQPGWIASLLDASAAGTPVAKQYTGATAGWVALGGSAGGLKRLWCQLQLSAGASGGTPTYSTWTNSALNTVLGNSISGASLASNRITLPTGTYKVKAQRSMASTVGSGIRLQSSGGNGVRGLNAYLQGTTTTVSGTTVAIHAGGIVSLEGDLTVTAATEAFDLQYFAQTPTGGSNAGDLGFPMSAGGPEVYANVYIEKVA